jgi:hypothetical protein
MSFHRLDNVITTISEPFVSTKKEDFIGDSEVCLFEVRSIAWDTTLDIYLTN